MWQRCKGRWSRDPCSSWTRDALVAGMFYDSNPTRLREEVTGYLARGGPAAPALGVLSPHAGYAYSGPTAGMAFAAAEMAETVVLLAPPHALSTVPFALWPRGAWRTPLGELAVEEGFGQRLQEGAAELGLAAVRDDFQGGWGHGEHSLEVQLPFIQVRRSEARIVPLMVSEDDASRLIAFGSVLARVIRDYGRPVLMVASSDMHHEQAVRDVERFRRLDELALERMVALDAAGLHRVVVQRSIGMCGMRPAVVMLAAAKELGARRAEVLEHTTSVERGGSLDWVVGYAAVVVR